MTQERLIALVSAFFGGLSRHRRGDWTRGIVRPRLRTPLSACVVILVDGGQT
jgi:hypothetical protein